MIITFAYLFNFICLLIIITYVNVKKGEKGGEREREKEEKEGKNKNGRERERELRLV